MPVLKAASWNLRVTRHPVTVHREVQALVDRRDVQPAFLTVQEAAAYAATLNHVDGYRYFCKGETGSAKDSGILVRDDLAERVSQHWVAQLCEDGWEGHHTNRTHWPRSAQVIVLDGVQIASIHMPPGGLRGAPDRNEAYRQCAETLVKMGARVGPLVWSGDWNRKANDFGRHSPDYIADRVGATCYGGGIDYVMARGVAVGPVHHRDDLQAGSDHAPITFTVTLEETAVPRSPEDAIAWGRKQIDSGPVWDNLCLKFVREAFGVYYNPESAWPSSNPNERQAGRAWDRAKHKHHTTDPNAIPRGVPVFWELPSEADHIALSIGDGLCLSNDYKRQGHIDVVRIADISARWGRLLGWTEDLVGNRVMPSKGGTPTPPPPPPAPVTFWIDIARYQDGLDLADVKRQGYGAVAIKCTEGQGYVSPTYDEQVADAKRVGLLTSAYHWLRDDSPIAAQADNIARNIGDKRIPVDIDCEPAKDSSGRVVSKPSLGHAAALRELLPSRGLRMGKLYLPEWYWAQIGEPSLKGWVLWESQYGDNPTGRGSKIYPGNDSARWDDFGGVTPTFLQFGSRGRIDGYPKDVDVNAFRGTLAELKALNLFIDWTEPQEDEVRQEDIDKIVAETTAALAPVITKAVAGNMLNLGKKALWSDDTTMATVLHQLGLIGDKLDTLIQARESSAE